MKKQDIEQDSAYTLAGLITDLMQKFRNGIRTLQDIIWFLNLSRDDLLKFQIKRTFVFNKILEIQNLFNEISPNNNYLDDYIINNLNSKEINLESNSDTYQVKIWQLEKNVLYEDLVKNMKKDDIYLELTLLQGLDLVLTMLKNGFFENGKDLLIPLSTTDLNGNAIRLYVHREHKGRFGLIVSGVDPLSTFDEDFIYISSKSK